MGQKCMHMWVNICEIIRWNIISVSMVFLVSVKKKNPYVEAVWNNYIF